MVLRDRCSTSYDLASLFCGRRSTLDRWSGQIAKRNGTGPSALHSHCPFLKDVSQNCFVFVWSISNIEEVSQTSFVFDVVKVKIKEVSQNCRVFDVARLKKMRMSRRKASFSSVQVHRFDR